MATDQSPMVSVGTQPITGQKADGRICFRGDTRSPSQMFSQGFYSRDEGSAQFTSIRYRLDVGDIDPDSAVCVTPRFAIAPLFPFDTEVTALWVYTVYARKVFNTHDGQYADGIMAIEHALAENPAHNADQLARVNLMLLFAHELATEMIAPADVICALKANRTWVNKKNKMEGVNYKLDKTSLVWNKLCTVDQSIKDVVKGFLAKEPDGRSPSVSSGFHKNSPKLL